MAEHPLAPLHAAYLPACPPAWWCLGLRLPPWRVPWRRAGAGASLVNAASWHWVARAPLVR